MATTTDAIDPIRTTPDQRRAELREATPGARVAFVEEFVAYLDDLEDRLIADLEWRCGVVDDLWNELVPNGDEEEASAGLLGKLLTLGAVISEGYFNKFPWEKNCDGTVSPLDFSPRELAELERRLGEVRTVGEPLCDELMRAASVLERVDRPALERLLAAARSAAEEAGKRHPDVQP